MRGVYFETSQTFSMTAIASMAHEMHTGSPYCNPATNVWAFLGIVLPVALSGARADLGRVHFRTLNP